jgi:hypothetical protein
MPSPAFRIDAQHLGARPMRRDARGMLAVPAFVTCTGIFTYKRADGTVVRELRHPEDVFAPEHIESLRSASVTIGHPDQHVTPANASSLEAGVVLNPRRDGNFVAAELSIRRADAIGKVERRELVELSCGYSLTVDPTPGVYEGQRYDQRQRGLVVNHVGLGPKGWGRAGAEVRIRADSGAELIVRPLVSFTDNIQAKRGGGMTREQFEEMEGRMYDRLDKAVRRLHAKGHPSVARTDGEEHEDEHEDTNDGEDDGDEGIVYDGHTQTLDVRFDEAVKRYRGHR